MKLFISILILSISPFVSGQLRLRIDEVSSLSKTENGWSSWTDFKETHGTIKYYHDDKYLTIKIADDYLEFSVISIGDIIDDLNKGTATIPLICADSQGTACHINLITPYYDTEDASENKITVLLEYSNKQYLFKTVKYL